MNLNKVLGFLGFILVVLIVLITFSMNNVKETKDLESTNKSRIKLVEKVVINNRLYQIIQVDDVEYFETENAIILHKYK